MPVRPLQHLSALLDYTTERGFGGEGGIRTHAPFPEAAFRERYHKPLGHLSPRFALCIIAFSRLRINGMERRLGWVRGDDRVVIMSPLLACAARFRRISGRSRRYSAETPALSSGTRLFSPFLQVFCRSSFVLRRNFL